MLDLAYIKYATEDNGHRLCLLSLAVFGPNTCCNYYIQSWIGKVIYAVRSNMATRIKIYIIGPFSLEFFKNFHADSNRL